METRAKKPRNLQFKKAKRDLKDIGLESVNSGAEGRREHTHHEGGFIFQELCRDQNGSEAPESKILNASTAPDWTVQRERRA
ncbi:hypothetical protein CEXT_273211, partial [Caerostris extrusa]